MDFIEYIKKEFINVKALDEQHEMIVQTLNKLYSLLANGDFTNFVKELEGFRELTRNHFEKENQLMITYKDPGYFSHQYEHSRISREIANGLNDAKNHPEKITIEFLEMLKRWFKNHLALKDQKLGKYLNSKGIY